MGTSKGIQIYIQCENDQLFHSIIFFPYCDPSKLSKNNFPKSLDRRFKLALFPFQQLLTAEQSKLR